MECDGKPGKPKLAVYWGGSCGGCEIALVNLGERLLALDERLDFFFCPCLLDRKNKDVEELDDGAIALTLFNGAARTTENLEMARLLRRKSRLFVAYGACASSGGIPALANLDTPGSLSRTVFLESPTVENPSRHVPGSSSPYCTPALSLPKLTGSILPLSAIANVDYLIPGCPPEPETVWSAIAILTGADLPPKGSVVGAGTVPVCDECSRIRGEKRLRRFVRFHEAVPRDGECLLDQGIVCMGGATRSGCGALCPGANVPCSGCYGPPEGVADQGAAMVGALGSVLDPGELAALPEGEMAARTDALFEGIPDGAGTFYRYSLAGSLLRRRRP